MAIVSNWVLYCDLALLVYSMIMPVRTGSIWAWATPGSIHTSKASNML